MENKTEIHATIDNDDQLQLAVSGSTRTMINALPYIIAHIIHVGLRDPENAEHGVKVLLDIALKTLVVLADKDEEGEDNA